MDTKLPDIDVVYGAYSDAVGLQGSPETSESEYVPVGLYAAPDPSDTASDRTLLGNGAFGNVYKGVYKGQPVAIKELDLVHDFKQTKGLSERQRRDSFLWEAQRLRSLQHPHIVRLLALVDTKDQLSLILEFCGGGTLEDVIREGTRANDSAWQWRCLVQLCSAVEAVHEHGMVHKDLKSENVLLTSEGHVKLADLGVSQVDSLVQSDKEEHTIDVVQRGLKDLRWASSEEVTPHTNTDSHQVSAQSDVFAIGLIAFHIVTGTSPFEALTSQTTADPQPHNSRLRAWVDALRQPTIQDRLCSFLPQSSPLSPLVRKCLNVDPSARPTSTQLLRDLLQPPLVLACHDSNAARAAIALVEFRHHLWLFPSQDARRTYVAPYVTDKEALQHATADDKLPELPDVISAFLGANDDSKGNNEDKSAADSGGGSGAGSSSDAKDNVGSDAPPTAHSPADSSAELSSGRCLLLLGDGGTGKTLTCSVLLERSLQGALPGRALPVLVRPGLPHWGQSQLAGALRSTLRNFYGLNDEMVSALRELRDRRIVFWVDAYDELTDDVSVDDVKKNLPRKMGLGEWPRAKLVVTCRRNVVPLSELSARFGVPSSPPVSPASTDSTLPVPFLRDDSKGALAASTANLRVRYILPFGPEQIQQYLEQYGTQNAEELDARSLSVLEIPFVLRLYAAAHPVATPVQDRVSVYHAAVRDWIATSIQQMRQLPRTGARALELALLTKPGAATAHTTVDNDDNATAPSSDAKYDSLLDSFLHFGRAVAVEMWRNDAVVANWTASASTSTTSSTAARGHRLASFPWCHAERVLALAARKAYAAHSAVAPELTSSPASAAPSTKAPPVSGTGSSADSTTSAGAANSYRLIEEEDYVTLQVSVWRSILASCPLQFKQEGTLSFLHKSMRDFFLALALTAELPAMGPIRSPYQAMAFKPLRNSSRAHALSIRPITSDRAVTLMAGELVDVARASAYIPSGKIVTQPFEEYCWEIVEYSREHDDIRTSAANCMTILNAAGVPFTCRDFSSAALGTQGWDPAKRGFPFMDLGGALLHGANLSKADLRGARLQQACLDDAQLQGADLTHVVWGEHPVFPHPCAVNAAVVSGDGRVLFTGGHDGRLRRFSTDAGTTMMFLSRHDGAIKGLSLSRDEQHLVSCSADCTARVWNTGTTPGRVALDSCKPECATRVGGSSTVDPAASAAASQKPVHVLQHPAQVLTVECSPDNTHVYTGAADGFVRVWNYRSGKCVASIRAHNGKVLSLALGYVPTKSAPMRRSKKSTYANRRVRKVDLSQLLIFSAGDDMFIRRWDARSHQLVQAWEGDTESINALALSPRGDFLFAGSDNRPILMWTITPSSGLPSADNPPKAVASADATNNDDPSDDTVTAERVGPMPSLVRVFDGHTGSIMGLAVSADGKFLFSCSLDKTSRQWLIATGSALRTFQGHSHYVKDVTAHHESLFSCGWDNTVRQFDLTAGVITRVSTEHHAETVLDLAVTADWVISGAFDISVRFWSRSSGRQHQELKGHMANHCHYVRTLCLSHDEQWLISCSDDGMVLQWSAVDGAQMRAFTDSASYIISYDSALTPDDHTLLLACWDSKIRQYDTTTGKEVRVLDGHSSTVTAITVSPDGQWAYSGGRDKTVRVWDIQTGHLMRTVKTAPAMVVRAVACSADGKTLFVAGDHEEVQGWSIDQWSEAQDPSVVDTATPAAPPLTVSLKAKGSVCSLAVPKHSKLLFGAGSQCDIFVWSPTTGELLHTLKGHKGAIQSLVLARDDRSLFSAGVDWTLRQWHVPAEEEQQAVDASPSSASSSPSLGLKFGSLMWCSPPYHLSARRAQLDASTRCHPSVRRMLKQLSTGKA